MALLYGSQFLSDFSISGSIAESLLEIFEKVLKRSSESGYIITVYGPDLLTDQLNVKF